MDRTFPHITIGSPGDLHFDPDQTTKSPEALRSSREREKKLERYANSHTAATHTVSLILSGKAHTAKAVEPEIAKTVNDSDTDTTASVSDTVTDDSSLADTVIIIPSSKSQISLSNSPYDSQKALDYATQYAYTLHETAHAKYTDFAASSDILGDLYGEEKTRVEQFAKGFINALEDGAIEHFIRQDTTERAAARQKLLNHFIRTEEAGQHSWLSALQLAALDFTVYDTGTFGALLDPANKNITFTSKRHRDVLCDILNPLYNLCGVVYHVEDPTTRYKTIRRFWDEYIKPLLDNTEQTSEQQSDQQSQQSASQQPQADNNSNKEDTQQTPETQSKDSDKNQGKTPAEQQTDGDSSQGEFPEGDDSTESASQISPTDSESAADDTNETGSPSDNAPSQAAEGDEQSVDGNPTETPETDSTNDNPQQDLTPDPTDTTVSSESPLPDDIGREEQHAPSDTDPSTDGDSSTDISDLPPPMSSPAEREGENNDAQSEQDSTPSSSQSRSDSGSSPPTDSPPETGSEPTQPQSPTNTPSQQDKENTPRSSSTQSETGQDSSTDASPSNSQSDHETTADEDDAPQQDNSEADNRLGPSTEHEQEKSDESNDHPDTNQGQLSLGDFSTDSKETDSGNKDQPSATEKEQPATEPRPERNQETTQENSQDRDYETTNRSEPTNSEPDAFHNEETGSSTPTPTPPSPANDGDGPELPADQEEVDKQAAEPRDSTPDRSAQEKDLQQELEKLDDAMESLQKAENGGNQSGSRSLDTSTLTVLPEDNPQAYDTDTWNDAVSEAEYTGKQLKQALTRSRRDERSRGRTSGRYDTGRAAAHAIGKTTYFRQRDFGGRRKYALMIVLDRSGSMAGEDINITEQAVTQFALAAEDIGIDVCVLDVYDDRPRILSPFNTDTETTASSLVSGYAAGTTPLTDTLVLARERIRQESTRGLTPLMLVVTDGKPNNRESYLQELETTRQEIPSILGITIDRSADSHSLSKEHHEQEQLFTAHEFITSPSTDAITTALESLAIHSEPLKS